MVLLRGVEQMEKMRIIVIEKCESVTNQCGKGLENSFWNLESHMFV